jgi:hypothetical protein
MVQERQLGSENGGRENDDADARSGDMAEELEGEDAEYEAAPDLNDEEIAEAP